jgi:hypothetical protein
MKNCGSSATGHYDVMMYTDGAFPNNNIKLIRNDIYARFGGIRIYGDNRSVVLDSNRITGGTAYNISSSGVSVINYSSGSVGYVAPTTTSTSPSYILTITSPASGATVSGIIQVKGTAPGMKNVEIFNAAGAVLAQVVPDSAGNFSASVDTTKLANGAQSLRIDAWDAAAGQAFSHSAEKLLSINVQNVVAPSYVITVTAPSSGATVSGTIAVKGTAPGMKNLEIFSAGGAMLAQVSPDAAGNFSASVNTTSLANGVQNLRLDAWDALAGQAFSHSNEKLLSINVQNGVVVSPSPTPTASSTPAPASFTYLITISSPAAGATVSGSIQVKGSASGMKNVEIFNAAGTMMAQVTPDASYNFSATINTAQLSNGVQNLTIRAWDATAGQPASHFNEKLLSVNVQNAVTSTSGAPTGPAANDISITSYGAVASGTTNNLSAIQNAINAAKSRGVNVFIPAGTFGYSGVIQLPGPVKIYGTGATSILRALDAYNETIMVRGSGSSISYLKLTIGWNGVGRQDPYECQRITLLGATNWVVDHVIIDGGSAAGIMADAGASQGKITNTLVQNTLADSIHMTGASNFIQINNNETNNSGDDGIAVVSYGTGAVVHDITASNNHIHNNKGGRGMTVVGGNNITYTNNYIHDMMNGASCFYVAQESSYSTNIATNVTIQNSTVKNCGGMGGNHGGILVWGDVKANNNIKLVSNLVDQSANSNPTIAITSLNTNVSLINNKTIGASVIIQSSSQVIQNTPYTSGTVGYTGAIGPQ